MFNFPNFSRFSLFQFGHFNLFDKLESVVGSKSLPLMMMAEDQSANESTDENTGWDDSDEPSSDPSNISSFDDPVPHDMFEPEPLRSDDISRINRATGSLDELTANDRSCSIGDSSALGSSEERSRHIQKLLQSIQDENRQNQLTESTLETSSNTKNIGERCNVYFQVWRDSSTFVHDVLQEYVGDSAATNVAGAMMDFGKNMCEMQNVNLDGVDKYYHCMANCEATSRGTSGAIVAATISIGREAYDFGIKNPNKGISLGENVVDTISDMRANVIGFGEGQRSGVRCSSACRPLLPKHEFQ